MGLDTVRIVGVRTTTGVIMTPTGIIRTSTRIMMSATGVLRIPNGVTKTSTGAMWTPWSHMDPQWGRKVPHWVRKDPHWSSNDPPLESAPHYGYKDSTGVVRTPTRTIRTSTGVAARDEEIPFESNLKRMPLPVPTHNLTGAQPISDVRPVKLVTRNGNAHLAVNPVVHSPRTAANRIRFQGGVFAFPAERKVADDAFRQSVAAEISVPFFQTHRVLEQRGLTQGSKRDVRREDINRTFTYTQWNTIDCFSGIISPVELAKFFERHMTTLRISGAYNALFTSSNGEARAAAPATGALRGGEALNHSHWLPLSAAVHSAGPYNSFTCFQPVLQQCGKDVFSYGGGLGISIYNVHDVLRVLSWSHNSPTNTTRQINMTPEVSYLANHVAVSERRALPVATTRNELMKKPKRTPPPWVAVLRMGFISHCAPTEGAKRWCSNCCRVKAVHDKVSTFEFTLRKSHCPCMHIMGELSNIRPVKTTARGLASEPAAGATSGARGIWRARPAVSRPHQTVTRERERSLETLRNTAAAPRQTTLAPKATSFRLPPRLGLAWDTHMRTLPGRLASAARSAAHGRVTSLENQLRRLLSRLRNSATPRAAHSRAMICRQRAPFGMELLSSLRVEITFSDLTNADSDNRNSRISRNALDADALRRNLLHPDWLPLISTHRNATQRNELLWNQLYAGVRSHLAPTSTSRHRRIPLRVSELSMKQRRKASAGEREITEKTLADTREPNSVRQTRLSKSYVDRIRTVRLLASHRGEPGSIPGRVAPGFPLVGIVPGDAAVCVDASTRIDDNAKEAKPERTSAVDSSINVDPRLPRNTAT
ncbi:hypothetical protein PR048_032728 [Dryococelus australis]|uniref:Uncharacterized protein n=1 Tax=Dryococelus australis TaxID=614101 RepID=A0ABQ9G774_9NEOP|nr:hypothetical protein PR048_032728 [Dryococelus australis]